MSDECRKCGGTGRVNLGTRSDVEYHSCPNGCPVPERLRLVRTSPDSGEGNQ